MITKSMLGWKIGLSIPLLVSWVFSMLKLAHIITWSWFWVFSPAIFLAAIGLIILGGMVIIAIAAVTGVR